MRICAWFLILTISCGLVCRPANPTAAIDEIHYKVLSKRDLTNTERASFRDVAGLSIAVRVRISNETGHVISYLAESWSIVPSGYALYREIGTSEWQSSNPSRGKFGHPGVDLKADTTLRRWLELPKNAVIEYELYDYSSSKEEHAFSIVIKDGEKEYEKFSDTFLPVIR